MAIRPEDANQYGEDVIQKAVDFINAKIRKGVQSQYVFYDSELISACGLTTSNDVEQLKKQLIQTYKNAGWEAFLDDGLDPRGGQTNEHPLVIERK